MSSNSKFESFVFRDFKINKEVFSLNFDIFFDCFFSGYPVEWELEQKKIHVEPIYDLVPFPLHPQYINEYKQFFEPSNFYRNVVTICAFAEKNTTRLNEYLDFLNKYVEYALTFSMTKGKSRFVTYNFELKRIGYILEKPWVSAIGNGFVVRALVRIYKLKKSNSLLETIRQYIRPYLNINTRENNCNSKWFTWLDKDGFLWFDEYPGTDNLPSLVLNGHIHAMHGLHSFLSILPESEEKTVYLNFYMAAMTTMKYKALEFRRTNKINRYSLREFNKNDYLPDRTVRQQNELYRITRNAIFKENAELFKNDIINFNNKV